MADQTIETNATVNSRQYYVVGLTHIDLAWLYDSHHYAQCQESVAARLLDLLDHIPDFTYALEQIANFRKLADHRPDLIKRLRKYVEAGRVEIAGAMASSLDTNGPNGEGFVRNHLLGQKWSRDNLGGEAKVGDLIDTFGISAQIPQIHRQFKLPYLIANRLGAHIPDDVFHARGIDGSTVLVAGPELHPARKYPSRIHFRFLNGYLNKLDELFNNAAQCPLTGPHLVAVYDENESSPSSRSQYHIGKNNNIDGTSWKYATFHEFFKSLDNHANDYPTYHGDLNPEFSGCFGLRPFVRLRNRIIETKLIEAEKWATLTNQTGWKNDIDNAWWNMAYIQSHDVYSGSFPHHRVRDEVIEYLDQTQDIADNLLNQTLGLPPQYALDNPTEFNVTLYNGLPFQRQDTAHITLPENIQSVAAVTCDNQDIPFDNTPDGIRILADVSPVGFRNYTIHPSPQPKTQPRLEPAQTVTLENDFIRVQCSAAKGIEEISLAKTGETLACDCGGLIIAQQDRGNFQRDDPRGCEVPATSGTIQLFQSPPTTLGQQCTLKGSFPNLVWAEKNNKLKWTINLFLHANKPRIDVNIEIDWSGEQSRVRIKLPTTIDRCKGIYEIPFGIVKRQSYGQTTTCHGNEWPTHRFVALENDHHGIALVNTGTIGNEVSAGCIKTTLFRAPCSGELYLFHDESSSQHGRHHFHFAIVPYSGQLADSAVLQTAQELNTPILASISQDSQSAVHNSFMKLSPHTCVLSAIKTPEDEAKDEYLIRFYESAGRETTAAINLAEVKQAWHSNLPEEKLEAIAIDGDTISIPVKPFEIKTIRIKR